MIPAGSSPPREAVYSSGAAAPANGLLRRLVRSFAYRSGALAIYHRLRNRGTLTVVVFHRVLRRDDPRWQTALSPWTVDTNTFDRCLGFFKRHYALVTLDDVRASRLGVRQLPSRALLITIDDGFADTAEYALPLLLKHDASAVVFVTSDMIGRERWLWADELLREFMNGRIDQHEIADLHALLFDEICLERDNPDLIWNIVRKGPELDEARVRAALSALKINLVRPSGPREMMTADEIRKLVASAISIGAHGKTHTAMPLASDVQTELRSPLASLSEIVQSDGQPDVDALSFPHGAHNPEIVSQALAVGYRLLFSGQARLQVLKNGFLAESLLPRVDVGGRRIAPAGAFQPDRLATLLFTVPKQRTDVGLRPADRIGVPAPAIESATVSPGATPSI